MKVFSHYGKEGADGRTVLTGMVTSNQVLGAVSQKWEAPGLFDAPHMNRLGHWCVTHYRKFNEAPGRQIQNYYAKWVQTAGRDKQEVKALDGFLAARNVKLVGAPDIILHYTPVAIQHGWRIEVDHTCESGVGYLMCDPQHGPKWGIPSDQRG